MSKEKPPVTPAVRQLRAAGVKLDLERIYINGGRRGYLAGIAPGDVVKLLQPTVVDVAISGESA